MVVVEEILSDCVIEASRLPYRKCRKGDGDIKINFNFHLKAQLIVHSLVLV